MVTTFVTPPDLSIRPAGRFEAEALTRALERRGECVIDQNEIT